MTMATTTAGRADSLHAALGAAGRAVEIPESADVYGWLVGGWTLDILHYRGIDLSASGLKGEVHFGWVLEGRAVQDVWIMPPRGQRRADGVGAAANAVGAASAVSASDVGSAANDMYGMTLRVWTPSIQAWRITWVNPVSGHREEQIGRRSGPDIVQLGTRADGTLTRWRYTEITPDSFHWLGEALNSDGETWRLEGEFRGTRIR